MSLIRPVLDLTRPAWKQQHGDIDVYGTWYWDQEDRTWVPALAIVRANTVLNYERTIPCIVPLDHAWAWSEENGAPEHVALAVAGFCNSLGLPPDKHSVIRVLGLVRDHLEDLIKRVPPRPPADDTTVTADAIITVQGRSTQSEIRDRV